MNTTPRQLNGAPSKKSTVVSQETTTLPQINSCDDARSANKITQVSISNSFDGERSSNVYQTKKVTITHRPSSDITNSKENWFVNKKKGRRNDKIKAAKSAARDRDKYKPHFGIEQISSLSRTIKELSDFSNVQVSEDILRKTEGIFALLINLKDCKDYSHFTSAIFLYIRDFYDESITRNVMVYINQLFENSEFSQQSDSEPVPNWLLLVKNLQTNWSLVKENRAFKQFSKLMGILVVLGLCDASNLQFSVGGFKMFDKQLSEKHLSTYDLADAIFSTVTYFAEGVYLCFQKGSIQPLLVNDFAVLELDEEYVNMLTWWDLVKNGNLEKFHGIADSEYTRRLDIVISKLTSLLSSLSGFDKTLVSNKLLKCKVIRNELTNIKISSGTRRSPFAIELFGESSQGKTTFGDALVDALLTSAGLSTDKGYRAALNPGDKFFSNWTSDKTVAILDDLANEKSAFVEKPPTRAIIDICNNQMYYAPKAELEAKGKCFVEPEIVVVTTNKKDLDAYAYSNCPYSIQRRMDLVFTVVCKPQFQRTIEGRHCGVDSAKVREFYTIDGVYNPPSIQDIWLLTIEQAVRPDDMKNIATYKTLNFNGKLMENITAVEAVQCAIEYFDSHRKNQIALIDSMRARETQLKRCSHAGCIHLAGYCPTHLEPQWGPAFGFKTAIAVNSIYSRVTAKAQKDTDTFFGVLEERSTRFLYDKTSKFIDKWDWMCLIPSKYLENEQLQEFVLWYYKQEIETEIYTHNKKALLLCLCFCMVNVYIGLSLFFTTWLLSKILSKSMTKKRLLEELQSRNDDLPFIIKNARDKYAKILCAGAASIAALYTISRLYRAWKATAPAQGSLEPVTTEEVAQRDEESNVWSTVTKRVLPAQKKSIEHIHSVVQKKVYKNLLYASVDNGDIKMMANVLFIKSNLLIIPNHYFRGCETLNLTCYKENSADLGGHFDTKLCLSHSYLIPNTDLRVCYSPTGGSYGDLSHYLPITDLVDHAFEIYWRKKDGTVIEGKGGAHACTTSNGVATFKGATYTNLSINTFSGMCGAVILSSTKGNVITGLHLGGVEGKPKGCFGTFTLEQFQIAEAHIQNCEGVLITGTAENFTPQMLGKQVLTDEPLHSKSPLNYLPENSQFEYYGSCPGSVTSRSDVRKTPISKHVTDVCDVENIWGAPKMKPEWFGWQTCLANASHPGKCFPADLLQKSVIDYKRPLIQLVQTLDWKKMKPLTYHENLCGIPGCKFVDAINLSTSIGYPLVGAKRKFITELEPTPDKPNNREFDPVIFEEIERCENLYRKGQRAFTIAKACKKDEVLPVAKGKCRIFYGNPISLTFLVRKYYLPVLRFLQMNPLKSECAVGINSHGPEWEQFHQHVLKFGDKQMVGGDYGKYDQKLPSQLLLAALRILIDIAAECNYTKEDLKIMGAMAGDIVYSLIAFNGDLIGLQTGTHISGNSLTVILNGVCGSLNLRNYFYSKYPETVHFQDVAHMMTYGDDNIGSASPDYPEFNIKSISEFLAEYGQVYTMPDKESELTAYLKPDEFEFLKRTSVYHEKLGVHVGALLDKSIFKSLHCYMRPKGCPNTPDEACALNIDSALREWFNHGKPVYESRRIQMKDVAQRADITHMCTMLDETYEDRVENWYHSYMNVECTTLEVEAFSPQSGSEERSAQYDLAISDVPFKLMKRDYDLATIAEIDLWFSGIVAFQNLTVFVEVKQTSTPSARWKANKQIERITTGFNIMNPKHTYIGCTYVGAQWRIQYIALNKIEKSELLKYMYNRKFTPFVRAVIDALENDTYREPLVIV